MLTEARCKVPMSFIYGEHDWLDPRAGKEAAASIGKLRGKLNPVDLTVWQMLTCCICAQQAAGHACLRV